MMQRAGIYLRKAGTIILGISILMWFVATYPRTEHFQVDADIAAGELTLLASDAPDDTDPNTLTQTEVEQRRVNESLRNSVAGRIGSALEPVSRPLGFDWKLNTAMLGAFAAKEVFISQLSIVYSMGEQQGAVGLRQALRRDYTPLVGFCLMLFLLISTPCMSTFAVTRRESGSWKWAALQLVGLTVIAYGLTFTVYQVGTLLGYAS